MKKYKDILIAFWQFLAKKPIDEIWGNIWTEEVDKSFAWLMLAVFGGLILQFLLIFLSEYLQGKEDNFYQEILVSGMLPFFSSAILISALTDYYLDPPNKNLFKVIPAFLLGVVPITFIVTSAAVVALYFGKSTNSLSYVEMDRLAGIQVIIFIGVVLYVFLAKLYHNVCLREDITSGNHR